MSTILDALKRLEDKTRSNEDQSVPGAMRGRGRAAGRPWRTFVTTVAVGFLVVGAALGAYWGYGKWAGRMPEQKAGPTSTPPSEEKNTSLAPRGSLPSRITARPAKTGLEVEPPAAQSGSKPKRMPANDPPQPSPRDASRRQPQNASRLQPATDDEAPANTPAAGSARARRAAPRATAPPVNAPPPRTCP